MTLPDDNSSPKSRQSSAYRRQNAAKTPSAADQATENSTPNSIESIGQRLQEASIQMQEQSDQLTQAIHHQWPDGQKRAAAEIKSSKKIEENQNNETSTADSEKTAASNSEIIADDGGEKTVVASAEKTADDGSEKTVVASAEKTADDGGEKTVVASAEKSDPQSDATGGEKSAEYGRQDTLNQAPILHPRSIWPD